jgi:flagellar FliL protein
MADKAKKAEAEIEAGEEGAEVAPKTKRKLPLKWLIVGAAALAVIGGGGGSYFFFFHHGAPKEPEHAAVHPAVFFDMPDVLVNLASTGSDRTQYLKVKVVLELPEQAMMTQIQPLMPRVMDAFQTYLRELRPTDLDGSAGLYRLKEELTRRVNTAVAPSRVTAVLFKEIVVQ